MIILHFQFILLLNARALVHDVAWICVRSKDAQKQLARTSLICIAVQTTLSHIRFGKYTHIDLRNYYMHTRHKIDIINSKSILYGSPLTDTVLDTRSELMTSSNHCINIQLTKFIWSCLDVRNILLSDQTNVTWLLYHKHNYMTTIIVTVLILVYKSLCNTVCSYGHANKARCCWHD